MAVQGVPVGGARGARRARPRRSHRGGRGDAPPPPADSGAGRRAGRRRTGRPGRSMSAWRPTCCRRSRSGRSRRSTNAGGYPGSPYFKITIAGTDRALAATADAELVVVPAFTGAPEQLWRIDQLADGTYRLMPKRVPNANGAAGAVGRRQQHADAREVQPGERSPALAAQDAMMQPQRSRRLPRARRAAIAGGRRGSHRARQQPTARPRRAPPAPTLTRPSSPTKPPDAAGFLQRWLCSSRSRCRAAHRERGARGGRERSTSRTSSPSIPHDGDTVTVGDERSPGTRSTRSNYNVNLYHFAYALNKPTSNVLFWAVTVVEVAARDARTCAWRSARTPHRSGGSTARR